MRTLAIGALVVLTLFFAAATTRLLDRERRLEARIAELERAARPRPAARPAPEPAVAAATPPLPAAPSAPAADVKPPVDPLNQAQKFVTRALVDVDQAINKAVWSTWGELFRKSSDESLGLSESQRRAVEALRKSRDLRTQVYRDEIRKIEEQTDLAIRQLLDADQQKKYDAAQQPQVELVNVLASGTAVVAEAAPANPGYLGVQADVAQGGGVTLTQVLPDTAASAAGLQPGDVVLEVDQEKIQDFAALAQRIRSREQGSPMNLTIRRGGVVLTQTVTLGPRPK